MWYKAENGSGVKPDTTDTTSSRVYNYIRKDFTLVAEKKDGDEVISPEHWEWLEQKILKADWETYQTVLGHDSALDDVQDALIELAELITEG